MQTAGGNSARRSISGLPGPHVIVSAVAVAVVAVGWFALGVGGGREAANERVRALIAEHDAMIERVKSLPSGESEAEEDLKRALVFFLDKARLEGKTEELAPEIEQADPGLREELTKRSRQLERDVEHKVKSGD